MNNVNHLMGSPRVEGSELVAFAEETLSRLLNGFSAREQREFLGILWEGVLNEMAAKMDELQKMHEDIKSEYDEIIGLPKGVNMQVRPKGQ